MFWFNLKSLVVLAVIASCAFSQSPGRNGHVARQPAPRNVQGDLPAHVASVGASPTENCPQSKVTHCLANLMQLNISALVETFKVYELLSISDVDEGKLAQQAASTKETCRVFNLFNDCTGGNFLRCFDKKKFIDIIQGFAAVSQNRPGSGSQMTSMMNDIAALITDQQIDYVGRAMIDACRRIQRNEVELDKLAICIRKDRRLLDQLGSLVPLSNDIPAGSSSKQSLSIGNHCKVFRCDVSRLLIHTMVRAAKNCSDENGAKFIFWVGQVALTGAKTAGPKDVVIANGEYGTQTDSDGNDHCLIRDTDYDRMKTTPAKTFSEIGVTRASQLCAAEVATTTKATTQVVFRYEADRPRESNKIALEATLDDLHNDLYWENSAPLLKTAILSNLLVFLSCLLVLINY